MFRGLNSVVSLGKELGRISSQFGSTIGSTVGGAVKTTTHTLGLSKADEDDEEITPEQHTEISKQLIGVDQAFAPQGRDDIDEDDRSTATHVAKYNFSKAFSKHKHQHESNFRKM